MKTYESDCPWEIQAPSVLQLNTCASNGKHPDICCIAKLQWAVNSEQGPDEHKKPAANQNTVS